MTQQDPKRLFGERIFVAAIGLFFAAQFGIALGYPADPRLFPVIVAAVGMLLVAVILLEGPVVQPVKEGQEIAPGARQAMALVVPPLFALALWALGFWIATAATIPTVAAMLGYRNRFIMMVVTIAILLSVGLLFPLVNVTLPKSALFGRYLFF